MKIDLYVTTYNDEDFLPFFLDYYVKLVDRITFIENGSTDKTIEIIKSYIKSSNPPLIIHRTGMTWWDWDEGLVLRNNIWRGSNFDYILFVDVDEIMYKENLKEYLKKTNYDIYCMQGFQMVADNFPQKGMDIITYNMGIPFSLENKYSLFKPSADITCINAHSILPTNSTICKGQIKLLHYKFLGVDILVKRAKAIKERVPSDSYTKGIRGNILQIYPGFCRSGEEYATEIKDLLRQAKKVI